MRMSHPATARLFIALELPEDARQELVSWARSALRAAAADSPRQAAETHDRHDRRGAHRGARHRIRVLDADLLHLTVSFLGSRPVDEIEPLSALVQGRLQPRMGDASIGAPLWLPRRRPRALAVEVHDDSGALEELHEVVHAELAATGLAASSPGRGARHHHAFRPHVTVARIRGGGQPVDRRLAPTPQRTFAAQRLVLYRSWLSQEGASYEEIASCATVPASACSWIAHTNNCSVRSGL